MTDNEANPGRASSAAANLANSICVSRQEEQQLADRAMQLGREWENLTRLYGVMRDEQARNEGFSDEIARLEGEIVRLREEQSAGADRLRDMDRELRQRRTELESEHRAFVQLLEESAARSPAGIREAGADFSGIEFAECEVPVVSIVIPVFNQLEFTALCLRSIHDNPPSAPYEVIVADDGSAQEVRAALSQVPGLKLSHSRENKGFIATCNRGAARARGRYLAFLNNDTQVRPGCFDELLRTFEIVPEAGLVGAKLLYPDGSLQEAGSIIWRSGVAWNYGKGDDSRKPEYNFMRDVDYCSAACIMVQRALFDSLSGFDKRYSPAYCEDSDLAFRIRARGKRVLYQPLAEVVHFEGMTAGTDTESGHKRYQTENTQKLAKRWARELTKFGRDGENPRHEKERRVAKRMLVIDACVLTPDQDAGSLTVLNFIRIFQSLGYKVTFVAENLLNEPRYTEDLQRIGIECLYLPYVDSIEGHLRAYGREYDAVFLCRPGVAGDNIDFVRQYCPGAKVIFDTEDLHFVRERRRAAIERDPSVLERAEMLRERELGIAAKADCTVVVSPAEREILMAEDPKLNVALVHPPRETYGPGKSFRERDGLIFIGGFQHTPNVDAALHFVDRIFPLIEARLRGVELYLVGSKPSEAIKELDGGNIHVTGYLPDLAEQATSRRVSVAPVRYGAGIKCKILTSFGYGLPVVASPLAIEGMGLRHGRDVLVAEDPRSFAEAVIDLYSDEGLWTRLARSGLECVQSAYSFESARERFAAILG